MSQQQGGWGSPPGGGGWGGPPPGGGGGGYGPPPGGGGYGPPPGGGGYGPPPGGGGFGGPPGGGFGAPPGGGFTPFRRAVDWFDAREIAIQPLLGELAFTRDNRNWGYQLRFGLFEIADADMDVIAAAMQRKCQAGAISGPECASRHAHAR